MALVIKCPVDFSVCEKQFSPKRSQQNNSLTLRSNNYSLRKSISVKAYAPYFVIDQKRFICNESKIEQQV